LRIDNTTKYEHGARRGILQRIADSGGRDPCLDGGEREI
jgi:hypothetical protein